jgi:hypothetical protein
MGSPFLFYAPVLHTEDAFSLHLFAWDVDLVEPARSIRASNHSLVMVKNIFNNFYPTPFAY